MFLITSLVTSHPYSVSSSYSWDFFQNHTPSVLVPAGPVRVGPDLVLDPGLDLDPGLVAGLVGLAAELAAVLEVHGDLPYRVHPFQVPFQVPFQDHPYQAYPVQVPFQRPEAVQALALVLIPLPDPDLGSGEPWKRSRVHAEDQ